MTPLAGAGFAPRTREPLYWLLAALAALLAHAGVALAMLWQPRAESVQAPPAAPMVMDVALLAAPQAQPSELPPGPEQTEAAPAPAPSVPEEPLPEPEPVEQEPLPEVEPEVVLETRPEPPPAPQEVSEQEPDPDVTTASDAPNDQAAPETTAPVSLPAAPSDVAAAPSVGAFSQQAADARQRWQSALQAHLERRKRYPRQAQMMRREGVPWVTFTMDRQGKVLAATLFRASGVSVLDEESLALIHRAEPLPTPPPEVLGETISLTVPVEFFIGR